MLSQQKIDGENAVTLVFDIDMREIIYIYINMHIILCVVKIERAYSMIQMNDLKCDTNQL